MPKKTIPKFLKFDSILDGQIMDIIYLTRFGVGFAHDDVEGLVYKIDQSFVVTTFYKQSSTNGLGGKQLKTNSEEDCLFVLSGPNTIAVFTEPHLGANLLVKIEKVKGTVITDYLPLRDDKIITVSDNGYLCIYRFAKNFQTLLSQLRLPIVFGQEQVVSLSMCPKNKYLVVSSSYISQSSAAKLFLLKIRHGNFELDLRYQRDYTFEEEYNQPNTLFSHLNIIGYQGDCPILYAYQLGNQKKVTGFLVHKDRLEEVYNLFDFHYSYSFMNRVFEGNLYSIDLAGNMTILPVDWLEA